MPLGFWVVGADTSDLEMKLWVNGQLKQESNTKYMLHSVKDLIADASRDNTLLPGTVILTGTPTGTQLEREEHSFLKPDDIVVAEIQGLGQLVNKVIKEKSL